MNDIFKPNYEKKQFSIVIDVYDNGLEFSVKKEEIQPKYYEVMGAIHQTLHSIMESQRRESKKEYAKHLKTK